MARPPPPLSFTLRFFPPSFRPPSPVRPAVWLPDAGTSRKLRFRIRARSTRDEQAEHGSVREKSKPGLRRQTRDRTRCPEQHPIAGARQPRARPSSWPPPTHAEREASRAEARDRPETATRHDADHRRSEPPRPRARPPATMRHQPGLTRHPTPPLRVLLACLSRAFRVPDCYDFENITVSKRQ